ncbi:MAG: hypothetical protein U9Q83_01195 [Bacteroidota bacterium]|nr:hypothetical protein [Bacteroidota bacterium]
MTENKIPLPKFYATELVKDALQNAELVLYYISEVGVDAQKSDIETITKAKEKLENDEWSSDIEVDFWIAYRNLTVLIEPVSVDSLKASQERVIKKPNFFQKLFKLKIQNTLALRIVRFYTVFAVLTMILMLVLHIYFSIGTIRLNRIQSADERIDNISVQLDEMALIIGTSVNLSADQKRQRLQDELFKVNTERNSNISLLKEWVEFVQHFFLLGTAEEDAVNENTGNDDTEDAEPGPPNFPVNPGEMLNKNIEVIQQAQNYVLIIGLYILPLFYGLLGAMTYVLRDLSNQTLKMQYKKESNINHILRLILGTIAGLAVGVFWGDIKQQDSFIIVRSLGPLIVAYLSGMTVEYIFSAIEKWIGSVLERALSAKKGS